MAQRYGRRRRRAHREMIAAQERTIMAQIMETEILRHNQREAKARLERFVEEMDRWDSDIRMMFGPYSALLFKMRELPIGFDRPDEIRKMPLPMHLGPVMALSEMPDEIIRERVAFLLHCAIRITDDRDLRSRFTTYIRLKITSHRESVYAFSEDYWHTIGRASQRDIHRLAEDIAKVMLRNVKNYGPDPTGRT